MTKEVVTPPGISLPAGGVREGEASVSRAEFLRMEALMVRWRIAAQRWTPGGSEYMDPQLCEDFIVRSRNEAAQTKVRYFRLARAARKVLAGLVERIDRAPKHSVPLFDGIADLSDELVIASAGPADADTTERPDRTRDEQSTEANPLVAQEAGG